MNFRPPLWFKPGRWRVIEDMPMGYYLASPRWGSGSLKPFAWKAGALAKFEKEQGNRPVGEAAFLGTAVHDLLADEAMFQRRYVQAPDFSGLASRVDELKELAAQQGLTVKSTKKKTEIVELLIQADPANADRIQETAEAKFLSESAGKSALTPDQWSVVQSSAASVREHPRAGRILEIAKPEVTVFFRDPEYNIPCKCRPDAWAVYERLIFDWKWTRCDIWNNDRLAWHILDMGYEISAAHYLAATGAEAFIWVFISQEPDFRNQDGELRHSIRLVNSANYLERGKKLLDKALWNVREVYRNNNALMPNTGVDVLPIPARARI